MAQVLDRKPLRSQPFQSTGRNCIVCGLPILRRKYCSMKCSRRFFQEKYRVDGRSKDYRNRYLSTHKEREKNRIRRYYEQFYSLWGRTGYIHGKEIERFAIETELWVAREVLPQHGFTEIILTREFSSSFFPFDILAKKNNQICLIEVSTCPSKSISKKFTGLIRFLSARVFVCHVKPDYTKYYLLELPQDKFYSSCKGLFMEYIRKGAVI